jgi:hypothetical protein
MEDNCIGILLGQKVSADNEKDLAAGGRPLIF